MEEDIKRWTAKRKSAQVLDIIQGKTTVAEASRQYDLLPSEVGRWVDDGKRGMENALRANPQDQGLQAEGITVSIAKPCRWLDVPRRTVYYKPVKSAPKVDPKFATPIKAMIEESPSFGHRTGAYLLGFNKNIVQRVFQLMGWQVRKRPIGFRPWIEALPSVAIRPNERWSTDLCRVWAGWLGDAGAGDRLSYA